MFGSPDQLNRVILLVSGGRDYTNRRRLYQRLDLLARKHNIILLVTGDCPTGTDLMAKQWAEKHNVAYRGYPADWSNLDVRPCIVKHRKDGVAYNAAAGAIRNKFMLEQSKANMGCVTKGNEGTANMVKLLKQAHVHIEWVDS